MIALTPEQRQTVESKFRDLTNQWAELTAYRSNMGALAIILFLTRSSLWASPRSL